MATVLSSGLSGDSHIADAVETMFELVSDFSLTESIEAALGEARRLPVDERKARWEEYQSLTPEERQRLAADHAKPPPGTAPALRPTPQDKLLRPRQGEDRKLPIYDNTLLPR